MSLNTFVTPKHNNYLQICFLSMQISWLPTMKITIYRFMKWQANRLAACMGRFKLK